MGISVAIIEDDEILNEIDIRCPNCNGSLHYVGLEEKIHAWAKCGGCCKSYSRSQLKIEDLIKNIPNPRISGGR